MPCQGRCGSSGDHRFVSQFYVSTPPKLAVKTLQALRLDLKRWSAHKQYESNFPTAGGQIWNNIARLILRSSPSSRRPVEGSHEQHDMFPSAPLPVPALCIRCSNLVFKQEWPTYLLSIATTPLLQLRIPEGHARVVRRAQVAI